MRIKSESEKWIESHYIEIITAALPAKRTMAHSHEWHESDGTEKCRKCGAVNKGIHTHPYTCWEEHQVVPNDHMMTRYVLSESDLREIGAFTRGNVLRWMESHQGVDWIDILTWGPIHDFHAVCEDVDIPWQNVQSQEKWDEVQGKHELWKENQKKEHPEMVCPRCGEPGIYGGKSWSLCVYCKYQPSAEDGG